MLRSLVGSEMCIRDRGDGSTFNMIKTFADVIEGSKVKTEAVLTINTDYEKVQQVLKEFGITKPESKD